MINIVVTSIQQPTLSIRKFAELATSHEFHFIVVGDKKTPYAEWPSPVQFHSLEEQKKSQFALAALIPENHYSRKNLGYLSAFQHGATAIYETDDDNRPLNNWSLRNEVCIARNVITKGWVNVYRCFSDDLIWPRGFPLECISPMHAPDVSDNESVVAPIQQCLANGAPDVDAIWRLILDSEFAFRSAPSISLGRGTWCPFNSQATWWFQTAYPLMYLPSYVSFRMTDIWRGFVAQRCLWELGAGLVFHSADVFQERNQHNLLKDFSDEIPGYLANEKIRITLEDLKLRKGERSVKDNLFACYEALVEKGFMPADELDLLGAWLRDLETLCPTS